MIRVIKILIIILSLVIVRSVSAQTEASWTIQVSIDNPSPYIGEPITYTIQIRYPESNGSFIITEPIFEGFGRTTYASEPTITRQSINQIPYLISNQSITLLPLRAGTFNISPYQIITPPTPFRESETIYSEMLTVTVRPLPSNRPESYTNAVGQFTITLESSHSDVIVGESFRLTMTISGTGNLEQLIPPVPTLPDSWNKIESQSPVSYESNRFGTRHFVWTIIPTRAEIDTIPPVNFVYFNPGIDTFETRQTLPIPINIIETAPSQSSTSVPVVPSTNLIPYMARVESEGFSFPSWGWLIFVIASPLLPLVAFILTRNRRAPELKHNKYQPESLKQFQAKLSSIDLAKPQIGFTQLENLLLQYVAQRTGRKWTSSDYLTIGKEANIVLYKHMAPILKEVSAGKYAPVTTQDLTDQMNRFRHSLNQLENQ